MIPLIRLKKDVLFNQELTKVVDVLKGIAAAQFHILEKQLMIFERCFTIAAEFAGLIDTDRIDHPFVRAQIPRTAAILVTSDAGFLGGLNTQVVTAGLREAKADGLLTVIGERGAGYLRDLRREATTFPGIEDTTRSALALEVTNHVVRQVLDGACGRLLIAYPHSISFTSQKITVETLLPCSEWLANAKMDGSVDGVMWESRVDEVLEYIVIQWLTARLSQIFGLSRLAELGARAVHLEGSHQELTRQGKQLKHQYFRARHEVIDRSMREIFASQLLSKHLAERTSRLKTLALATRKATVSARQEQDRPR